MSKVRNSTSSFRTIVQSFTNLIVKIFSEAHNWNFLYFSLHLYSADPLSAVHFLSLYLSFLLSCWVAVDSNNIPFHIPFSNLISSALPCLPQNSELGSSLLDLPPFTNVLLLLRSLQLGRVLPVQFHKCQIEGRSNFSQHPVKRENQEIQLRGLLT